MTGPAARAVGFPAPAHTVHFDLETRTERVLGPGDPLPPPSASSFLWVDVELPAPDAVAALVVAGLLPGGPPEGDATPGAIGARSAADHAYVGLVGARLRGGSLVLDRRDVVITEGVVVSAHRGMPGHFDALRARYRDDYARFARSHGFLVFEFCTRLAEDLHAAVRDLGDRIDELRVASLRAPGAIEPEVGADLLSSVLLLRRILTRTRDVLVELSSRRSPFVPETTQPYLRDVAHRLDGQLSDLAFSRDVLSGALSEAPARESEPGAPPGAGPVSDPRAETGLTPLRFIALGGFEVRRGNEPIAYSAFGGQSARSALAALVCAGGPVGRRELARRLWPELDESQGARRLDSALSALRSALEPEATPDGSTRLVEEGDAVRLALGARDSWDVEEFLARAREAAAAVDTAERVARHESALALYRGPAYPEWPFAEWSRATRESCEHAHRALRAGLAEALTQAGRAGEAVSLFEGLLEAEPECEAWHRGLMCAHAEAGNRSVALRQFHTCRSVLRQTRGAEPSPETQDLYLELLRR